MAPCRLLSCYWHPYVPSHIYSIEHPTHIRLPACPCYIYRLQLLPTARNSGGGDYDTACHAFAGHMHVRHASLTCCVALVLCFYAAPARDSSCASHDRTLLPRLTGAMQGWRRAHRPTPQRSKLNKSSWRFQSWKSQKTSPPLNHCPTQSCRRQQGHRRRSSPQSGRKGRRRRAPPSRRRG